MKIPTSVKIACYTFKIEVWNHKASNANEKFGECSLVEQILRVDEGLIGTWHFVSTLLHEINHAIHWSYDIDDADKEERIVCKYAVAWTQIYRDNPELSKFLAGFKETE